MKFRFFDYYTGRTGYQIWFLNDLSEQEFIQLTEMFRYHCRKNNVSWLCGFSSTSSDSAKIEYIHTGKRGRPKKEIIGDSVDPHMHNILIGSPEKSAYSTAHEIERAIKRKHGEKSCQVHSVSDGQHLCRRIEYITRQSDIYRSGGDFDFKEYYERTKDLFC